MEKALHLKVRISELEKNKIKENAKTAGLTVSQFARKMLIDGKINVMDLEHKRTIAGIANNLNQIARVVNTEKNLQMYNILLLEGIYKKIVDLGSSKS